MLPASSRAAQGVCQYERRCFKKVGECHRSFLGKIKVPEWEQCSIGRITNKRRIGLRLSPRHAQHDLSQNSTCTVGEGHRRLLGLMQRVFQKWFWRSAASSFPSLLHRDPCVVFLQMHIPELQIAWTGSGVGVQNASIVARNPWPLGTLQPHRCWKLRNHR